MQEPARKIIEFPSRARTGEGGGGDDDVIQTDTGTSLEHHHHHTASELRLARWLRDNLLFNGAEAFVFSAGAKIVLAALRRDVLQWSYTRKRWEPAEGLMNPAGMLRKNVRARTGKKV